MHNCPFECGAAYSRRNKLIKHLCKVRLSDPEGKHPKENGIWPSVGIDDVNARSSLFPCPFCDSVYQSKNSLKDHLILIFNQGGNRTHPAHHEIWNRSDVMPLLVKSKRQTVPIEVQKAKRRRRNAKYRQRRREILSHKDGPTATSSVEIIISVEDPDTVNDPGNLEVDRADHG